jgi:NTE family protein
MKKKTINLALQGGGSHGAFTWGVLDKLLESELFTFDGISATSAGSMNAIVLAQGMLNGGEDGARTLLHDFWFSISEYGKKYSVSSASPMDSLLEPYLKGPVNFHLFNAITNLFSPYQFNPSNFHPIREVLENIIDFEQLKKNEQIKLFVCATTVKTGKIRIFNNDELSVEAVLASACLPKLFQAVEVDHEYYWDGGYLGNPAIFPLIYHTQIQDILVVHTVPLVREEVPTSVLAIETRLREVSFNSSLMREMRAIGFVTKLIDEGWLKKEHESKVRKVFMHCLIADDAIKSFPMSSVYKTDWEFLVKLRDLGRLAAENWLKKNLDSVGKKTTVDFKEW